MQIGEVVGTVVSTIKEPSMNDLKLQIVRILDAEHQPTGAHVVCVDAVGAGHGDAVLVATGSSARQTRTTNGKPADATIMAVIDSWDVEGRVVYRAGQ